MKCQNCGMENEEGAKFCGGCGSRLESGAIHKEPSGAKADKSKNSSVPQKAAREKRKKSKRWIWILCAVILLLICAAIGVFIGYRQVKEKQYQSSVEEGNRYLEELDYENAEASYLEAISIEPKKKEPYVKLTDIYLVTGEKEKAVEIIAKAKESLPKEEQKEFEEKETEIEHLQSYTWVVEPQIEAEDIYYVKDNDYAQGSLNELNRQYTSEYAVIRDEEGLCLIGMDGEILSDMRFDAIDSVGGRYELWLDEPVYEEKLGEECAVYLLQDGEIVPTFSGVGGGAQTDAFYYSQDSLYSIWDDTTMTWCQRERESLVIPVQESQTVCDIRQSAYEFLDRISWWSDLDGKYAVCSNEELVTDFIYDLCGAEADGLLAVKQDGKIGYINSEGKTVIPLEYDSSWEAYCPYGGEEEPFAYAVSEGCVPLAKDGVWEMRDTEGNLVIYPGAFEEILPLYDGKCWVKKDGKWGVIALGGEDLQSGKDTAVDEEKVTIDTQKAAEEICGNIKAQFGEAAGEEFLSCQASEMTQFPASAMGFVSHCLVDIDGDDIEELLVTYINPDDYGMYQQFYRYQNGSYEFVNEMKLTDVDCFSQVTAYLFYNETAGTWQVFCSNNMVGSYTGSWGFTARLFSLSDILDLAGEWSWNDSVHSYEAGRQIAAELQASGVTYLEAGNLSFGQYDGQKQTLLGKTDIRVEGSVPTMYSVFLSIYNEEQLQNF